MEFLIFCYCFGFSRPRTCQFLKENSIHFWGKRVDVRNFDLPIWHFWTEDIYHLPNTFFIIFDQCHHLHFRVERSSDQVIKPINVEALKKWQEHFPEDVLKNAADVAPMLARLGYDPYIYKPDYGSPDALVRNYTNLVSSNSKVWQDRAEKLLSLKNAFDSAVNGKAEAASANNGSEQKASVESGKT